MPLSKYWGRVNKTESCWIWTGCKTKLGYGSVGINGKDVRIHRLFYEALVGQIPPGLQLDHLCRNPSCVNPEHLEPVTPRVNTLRGIGPTAVNAKKTHCLKGHPFSSDNTYTDPDGKRYCRICRRLQAASTAPHKREYWRKYWLIKKERMAKARALMQGVN